MSELNIETITFSSYQYSIGDYIQFTENESPVYGVIRESGKGSVEMRDSVIEVDDGENAYTVEIFDTDEGKFSDELVAITEDEKGLGSWIGPPSQFVNKSEFSEHDMDKEKISSMWDKLTNMSEEEMEKWDKHPCSDIGVDGAENTRDETLMLMGQAPDGWNEESYLVATQHISHIAEARESEPDDPAEGGEGTCPSRWAVNLLNRGMNPFDSFPGGNPNFAIHDADSVGNVDINFSASAVPPKRHEIVSEFNEFGIRKNRDSDGELVSVDAVYEAMTPGPPKDRNGVRITSEFLESIASKDYSNDPPYMMDHSQNTLSQIGFVKDVWFNSSTDTLMVMTRAYNTGSQTHDEIIKRLTFEPPTIDDGSLGLADDYDYEQNEDGEIVLADGRIKEFSTTPFPGGYDEGGLKTSYDESESSEVGVVINAS
jgi:hypothetical protein